MCCIKMVYKALFLYKQLVVMQNMFYINKLLYKNMFCIYKLMSFWNKQKGLDRAAPQSISEWGCTKTQYFQAKTNEQLKE